MPINSQDNITVVAGIPPGNSGTGQMVFELMNKSTQMDLSIKFVHNVRPEKPLRPLAKNKDWKGLAQVGLPYYRGVAWFYVQMIYLILFGSGKLLIMHPQTIGYRMTIWLIKRWPRGKVYMYVLDSSYFCSRSYNYIPGEVTACTRCLGGDFKNREQQGCKPFPVPDAHIARSIEQLFLLGRQRRINFMSQNKTQRNMLKKHFGEQASVDVVGLWGDGWTKSFDKWRSGEKAKASRTNKIVYHGFYVPAKGGDWFVELARLCPELQFMCPFSKPVAVKDAPANIEFKFMTWETGLEEVAEQAWMVMVPSLWSAPIEGALAKSMVAAQRVGIQVNETAFQNEIPDEVVLRLPNKHEDAAALLSKSAAENWTPGPEALDRWLAQFQKENHNVIESLIDRIKNS